MIIKGHNSGHNKITHNKVDFRDGVCLKPLNGFEWKSLCVMIMTYILLMNFKCSDILYGGLLWPSYNIGQLTDVCLIQAKKGPNNCFKRFYCTLPYLTSIILFQICLHPKISVVFNTIAKNENFLISSIISTAVSFKVLCRFLIGFNVFWWHAMKSDSNPVFSNVPGMILKFWSWRAISVTSNAACLKIVPNNNTFFVYTPLWQVLCNLKHSIDSLCAWNRVKSTVSVESRVFGLTLWGGGKYFGMFPYS